jgi:hypothetical protein
MELATSFAPYTESGVGHASFIKPALKSPLVLPNQCNGQTARKRTRPC